MDTLLEVRNLTTSFKTELGFLKAVDDIGFSVGRGETLGIIGESGCGKSVTALSIMGLIQQPPGAVSGSIRYQGRELRGMKRRALEDLRADEIAMIFQEPMTALHPMHSCGYQVAETLRRHKTMDKRSAFQEAARLFELVGMPDPEGVVRSFPHQLSGGMRQRVTIAIALCCSPSLLIADEITTAIDVTIQAQVLELLRSLRDELHMSIIIITHDMGVIAEIAERVIVMYTGKIVEEADTGSLFKHASHPYTQGLLQSIPRIEAERHRTLATIEGKVPNLFELPEGCHFRPRCPYAMDACHLEPSRLPVRQGHHVSCWKYADSNGADPSRLTP